MMIRHGGFVRVSPLVQTICYRVFVIREGGELFRMSSDSDKNSRISQHSRVNMQCTRPRRTACIELRTIRRLEIGHDAACWRLNIGASGGRR